MEYTEHFHKVIGLIASEPQQRSLSPFVDLTEANGAVLILNILRAKHHDSSKDTDTPKLENKLEPTAYPPVESLPDFEWQHVEPLKLRPFKPKYHLTMSIEDSNVNELIEFDKNYVERIALRKQIMKKHSETVLAAEDCVKSAVDEFYTWLVGNYLPTRFPQMFKVIEAAGDRPAVLHNLPTGEKICLSPADKPVESLRIMGSLVEDDLLFLLPSTDGDGYTLKGFVTCFPSGFNTRKKLNLKLRDIHKPVPRYKQKLEKSMDRYFDKLKTGKFVKRANWTVTTTDQLFRAHGNHLYEGEAIPEEDVNITEARVRCERQVLHRLPRTRAILFSFKTYLYTLPEIKAEGLGETLAEAIDGLKDGSVPEFHFYKRAAIWGESIKAYLRA
ncbi:hypothetical protein BDV59DRAFT_209938 [Aspergillus ambiguus]|uniref:heme-dependent oxidative N-demethylase family protein n=1 Tax=Aspergillus ambiguus TaxID=176160 RepID=UPI003CCD37E4